MVVLNFNTFVIDNAITDKKFSIVRLQKKRKNTIPDNIKFVDCRKMCEKEAM